ncbi:MAG: hypothetical protein FRX49_06460 [Trebouxia sp. A1-2]|nr:MAG: hypothetical protein FRX49_06460 [Trebouxia sp. A1-2]
MLSVVKGRVCRLLLRPGLLVSSCLSAVRSLSDHKACSPKGLPSPFPRRLSNSGLKVEPKPPLAAGAKAGTEPERAEGRGEMSESTWTWCSTGVMGAMGMEAVGNRWYHCVLSYNTFEMLIRERFLSATRELHARASGQQPGAAVWSPPVPLLHPAPADDELQPADPAHQS